VFNERPAAKSLAKDIVQKINMMEENNQYRNAQQFLSPLKLVGEHLSSGVKEK
jgi:hypothetical protein